MWLHNGLWDTVLSLSLHFSLTFESTKGVKLFTGGIISPLVNAFHHVECKFKYIEGPIVVRTGFGFLVDLMRSSVNCPFHIYRW